MSRVVRPFVNEPSHSLAAGAFLLVGMLLALAFAALCILAVLGVLL